MERPVEGAGMVFLLGFYAYLSLQTHIFKFIQNNNYHTPVKHHYSLQKSMEPFGQYNP